MVPGSTLTAVVDNAPWCREAAHSVRRDMSRFDLDKYLERIGLFGQIQSHNDARTGDGRVLSKDLSTLQSVLRHHTETIPFENLSVLQRRQIGLDTECLQRKLVEERRGGYCFEQNLLLSHALEALGFKIKHVGGRVRWYLDSDLRIISPRTHFFLLVLDVESKGDVWVADAGPVPTHVGL